MIPKIIPHIIHQTWKVNDVSTYFDGKVGVLSQNMWKKLYPDFEYKLWTDKDIANLFEQEEFSKYKETYNTLNAKIKKVDFARYIILNKYGGIYSDLDFIPTKRLPDDYFKYDFIGYRAPRNHLKIGQQHQLTINRGSPNAYVLGQAFFCSVPNHVGLEKLIDSIVKNRYSKAGPLLHTGPERINCIFIENNLIGSEKMLLLTKEEVSDHKGVYGYHLKKHQW